MAMLDYYSFKESNKIRSTIEMNRFAHILRLLILIYNCNSNQISLWLKGIATIKGRVKAGEEPFGEGLIILVC
jgi:hypothetical protein